jgi:hypothetical protein
MHVKTAVICCAALLLAACALPQPPTPGHKDIVLSVPHTPTELLYNDIFAQDFVSTNVTILGVTVGMTADQVKQKLGSPDQSVESDFGGVQNLLYGKSLGLNNTGLIIHLERNFVTRIIITDSMAPLLKGNSRPGRPKETIYGLLGVPNRQYDFPINPASRPAGSQTIIGRFFVYNKIGLEVYLVRGTEYQYAFVYPNRKLPTTAFQARNLSQEELLNPVMPVLITDTTTLCTQGKTYGYDPASPECKEFAQACDIPDNWVEITNCDNRPAYVPPTPSNTTNESNTTRASVPTTTPASTALNASNSTNQTKP